MARATKIREETLAQVTEEGINENDLYSITDFPIGGITQQQMINALTVDQDGFYLVNSVYMCIDDGNTYLKNHCYKFTPTAWVDITPWKKTIETNLTELSETTIDENAIYSISDYPIGGITQQQMLNALEPEQEGFYLVGSVYLCIDSGNYYVQNHFYRFDYSNNTYSWVDTHARVDVDNALSANSSNPVENSVITNALNSKVGLTGNETIEGTKTFSTRPLVGTTTISGVALQSEIPQIQANNQEATTETLTKLSINGINYAITGGGGSTVTFRDWSIEE